MRIRWIAGVVAVVLLLSGCAGTQKQGATGTSSPDSAAQQAKSQAGGKKQWQSPPPMQIDPNKQYYATLKTSMGDIRIELWAKDAPKTVNNFVFLARQGFYDGVIFHRVIQPFMIQTGDPTGSGSGGPGYEFPDELPVKHSYDPGIVAMANHGPNTNGSQFFICSGPQCKGLDKVPNYTQFGKVVAGMDVVAKIAGVEVEPNPAKPDEKSRPKNPPVIQTVTIEER
jgi:cyclophilin family peptidyl-prolyl cis-trans isomerase